MSTSVDTVTAERISPLPGLRRLVDPLPGIALLLLLGYAGKVTEQSIAAYGRAHHLTLTNIEYVLWAIVFGLIVANTVSVSKIFDAGIDTYEFWLKTGIVLLGVRFLLRYALYWIRRSGAPQVANKAAFLWEIFPKFVLGFIAISTAATLGVFTRSEVKVVLRFLEHEQKSLTVRRGRVADQTGEQRDDQGTPVHQRRWQSDSG